MYGVLGSHRLRVICAAPVVAESTTRNSSELLTSKFVLRFKTRRV